MKKLSLVLLLSCLLNAASAQKIYQVLTIEYNTESRYTIGRASDNLAYNLFHKNKDIWKLTKLSPNNNINKDSLDDYFKAFNAALPKNMFAATVMTINDRGTTYPDSKDAVWQELNYYSIDTVTKKITQLTQLQIIYDGNDAETVARNPLIKSIHIRTGKQMIDRTNQIKKFKVEKIPRFSGPPPAIEEMH